MRKVEVTVVLDAVGFPSRNAGVNTALSNDFNASAPKPTPAAAERVALPPNIKRKTSSIQRRSRTEHRQSPDRHAHRVAWIADFLAVNDGASGVSELSGFTGGSVDGGCAHEKADLLRRLFAFALTIQINSGNFAAGFAKWNRDGRSALRALFSYGEKDYYLGGSPIWQLFRVAYRMTKKPVFIGGLALLFGYCWAAMRRMKRAVTPELMHFNRREQMRKLRAIFRILRRFKKVDSFRLTPTESHTRP